MLRNLASLVLALLLLLSGCTTKPAVPRAAENQTAGRTSDAATGAVTTPSQSTASQPNVQPTTVSGWNDRAFERIKEQRWEEAIAAAKAALALDAKSSAGYFNLGRAYLGAGKAYDATQAFNEASRLTSQGNADVEYFRGQAFAAYGNAWRAAVIYSEALTKFPGDAQLAAALAELRAKHKELAAVTTTADVDGDGQPDQITVDLSRVTVVSGKGRVLYDGHPWGDAVGYSSQAMTVQVFPMPEGAPLLDVQIGGCPAYYQHTVLWYDRAAGVMKQINPDVLCSLWDSLGGGRIRVSYRAFPYARGDVLDWRNGSFVAEPQHYASLLWADVVTAKNLQGIVQDLLSGDFNAADDFFAQPTDYATLKQRLKQGKWSAGPLVDAAANPLRVPLLQDGNVRGYLLFDVGTHKVSAVEWSP